MKRSTILFGLATLLAAGSTPAMAQAPKISGLLQVWYSQMLDNNLRLNTPYSGKYYNLRGEFTENTFGIRRAEIKFAGTITNDVEYEVMIDPSIATGTSNPSILQDAVIVYKIGGGFEAKLGQFKNLQTLEGVTSSSEIMFAERAQLARQFGDKRDRGVALGYKFGDPKEFGGKATLALFNGLNDSVAGKGNDTNAQKDFVARLELNYGKAMKFGLYALQGSTDQADKGGLLAKTFTGAASSLPTAVQILDNKDKTSNMGAFYVYQDSTWLLSAEVMAGLLGRRFASVGATGAAARQHLDQKYMGYWLTGGYTTGNHTFLLRYDTANYNTGDDWYGSYNPYTQNVTTGAALGADYSPKYTEISAGYLYAFQPEKLKAANIKINYINRSKNFLQPRPGQTGEQGGDTLVAAFQIAF